MCVRVSEGMDFLRVFILIKHTNTQIPVVLGDRTQRVVAVASTEMIEVIKRAFRTSEPVSRRAGCVNYAGPDPRGAGVGDHPGLPA